MGMFDRSGSSKPLRLLGFAVDGRVEHLHDRVMVTGVDQVVCLDDLPAAIAGHDRSHAQLALCVARLAGAGEWAADGPLLHPDGDLHITTPTGRTFTT
jgi:hypothetical protein